MSSCSFCGRPEKQVGRLIFGPAAAICSTCVDTAMRSFDGVGTTKRPEPKRPEPTGGSATGEVALSYPPAPLERERLLLEARAGSNQSFRELVQCCLGITGLTAAAFAPAGVSLPDVIVEGNAVLVRLIRDPEIADPLLDLPRAIAETLAERLGSRGHGVSSAHSSQSV